MPAFIDLTGRRFGALLVLSRAANGACSAVRWNVRCDCGSEHVAYGLGLRNQGVASCKRCVYDSRIGTPVRVTHARSGTPIYWAWVAMIQRCANPRNSHYRHYGGRGIAVCERWRLSFEDFLADVGERPNGMTLDRVDVNGNYEPGNCRWASKATQAQNRRSTKLTDETARDALDRLSRGESVASVAALLGVSVACIKDVRLRTWNHLRPAAADLAVIGALP